MIKMYLTWKNHEDIGWYGCTRSALSHAQKGDSFFWGLKRSHQLPSDWHYKLFINGTTFRGAINHGLRCLQLRLVTWCVPMEKIAVEMHPPFFLGPAKTAFKLARKRRYSYKTSFFLHSLFFAWIAFSDHKEGDILLKTTTFTSSISWDNWQDAISSTGCRVALKFG